jgi:hypothetical protein
MKKLLFSLIICCLSAPIAQAQIYSKLAYQVGVPLGQMNRNISKNAHGIAGELGLHFKNTPITLGWHWGIAGYGYSNTKELNVFAEGAQSNVLVEVGNYYTQSQFFVNYEFRQKKFLRPYLSAGLGRSHFRTFMTISAETSTEDCPKPLETGFPLKDKTMHYMVGGGVKLELAPFLGMQGGKSFCLDFQVQHTRGGKVEYLSLRKAPTATPTPDVVPVYARFASQAKPDVIHQYYAGDTHTSRVRLLTFQIGFSYIGSWGESE